MIVQEDVLQLIYFLLIKATQTQEEETMVPTKDKLRYKTLLFVFCRKLPQVQKQQVVLAMLNRN